MEDINSTIAVEARKRNLPVITMSAGAVIARRTDNYTALSKIADDALYKRKKATMADLQAHKQSSIKIDCIQMLAL